MDKEIRVWVDGCFDCMHYGHANALRQAKAMGNKLVVGVHSDKDILINKGQTVFGEEERYASVLACKWVDEIVKGSNYTTQLEDLDTYNCDFCVHGDDITTTADGSDCYGIVKQAGRYKECKRTEGISTTDLVSRMLLRRENPSGFKPVSNTALVSSLLKLFKSNKPIPLRAGLEDGKGHVDENNNTRKDRVVYIQGSWDMFHTSHIKLLQKAREYGTFLLVGIESDQVVFEKTKKYPILDTSERGLSVLACRYVDNIVECGSFKEVIEKYDVEIVVCTGTLGDLEGVQVVNVDPGGTIYDLGSERVIKMILDDYQVYKKRNSRKGVKAELEESMRAKESLKPSI